MKLEFGDKHRGQFFIPWWVRITLASPVGHFYIGTNSWNNCC